MPTKKQPPPKMKAVRASVSFPAELYRTIEELAKQKKVSVAWVVREAVEKYVAEQSPLFNQEAWRR